MKNLFFLSFILSFIFQAKAQPGTCVFKPPAIKIDFGAGSVSDPNTTLPYLYDRVFHSCPSDGYYSFTSFTSDCFRGDWLTLDEDHTPGDAGGNMMLVNAAPNSGTFFSKTIDGLKTGSTYEFGVWMMNLCRISDKCPFPLLPNISILLQAPDGKLVAKFGTGELVRREAPHWTQYRAVFTMPASVTSLTLTMIDNSPGGCGNDFALDDISFRECERIKSPVTTAAKTAPVKQPLRIVKRTTEKKGPGPVKRPLQISTVATPKGDTVVRTVPAVRQKPAFPAPPALLTKRTNQLIKQLETEAGEIKLDLYDNGTIDGDTVSVYHNNRLLVSHARLSQNPITFRIAIDAAHPHHELIMVAHNLGEIPPNTSLMIVTAGTQRYEVYISSNEQKNAKVVLDLKE